MFSYHQKVYWSPNSGQSLYLLPALKTKFVEHWLQKSQNSKTTQDKFNCDALNLFCLTPETYQELAEICGYAVLENDEELVSEVGMETKVLENEIIPTKVNEVQSKRKEDAPVNLKVTDTPITKVPVAVPDSSNSPINMNSGDLPMAAKLRKKVTFSEKPTTKVPKTDVKRLQKSASKPIATIVEMMEQKFEKQIPSTSSKKDSWVLVHSKVRRNQENLKQKTKPKPGNKFESLLPCCDKSRQYFQTVGPFLPTFSESLKTTAKKCRSSYVPRTTPTTTVVQRKPQLKLSMAEFSQYITVIVSLSTAVFLTLQPLYSPL